MTELRYISWKNLLKSLLERDSLDSLLKGHSLQWWLSTALRKQNFMVVSLDKVPSFTISLEGCSFNADLNYPQIFSIYKDYPLNLIRSTDIVVDLGANIGTFSIPAAKRASRVYSVEPLYQKELKANLELNGISNIEIIEEGIGNQGKSSLEFFNRSASCKLISFSELLKRVGRVDFLKTDIEGYEWAIEPKLFKGIRVITGEAHKYTKKQKEEDKWKEWNNWFLENNYKVEVNDKPGFSYEFTASLL